MIAGGRQLSVDLANCDPQFYFAAMVLLTERYGTRAFVTDDPRQRAPMQTIANYLGRAAEIYASLPVLPAVPVPSHHVEGTDGP